MAAFFIGADRRDKVDITKLDLNWGGAGFPSYEGRLEDDPNPAGPMDSEARQDAALAAFSGDDPAAAADPNASADPNAGADPNAAAAADPNQADPNAADPNAPQGLTDEQRQADPQFQALNELRDNVVNTLSEFGIPVDDKGNPDLNETKAQLSDSKVLYDIMQGKGTPSQLLDTMATAAHWTDGQKQLVAQDLIGWLTKTGYLKDGQAGGKPPAAGGVKDPLVERLDNIEKQRKDEATQAEQTRVQQHQTKVYNETFLPQVTKLCEQKSIPKEYVKDYALAIAKLVNGNAAITKRIEAGNFVDVQKFFTQIHNKEVAKLAAWTKSQTAAAQKKSGNPRIPAGGAPPAPAGSAKVNTRDRDSRIAAASEML